jgi:hypothetical protein
VFCLQVSLSNMNVYACLICGKYFGGTCHLDAVQPDSILFLAGRGVKTHAYLHSVECDHHVFINLHNEQVRARCALRPAVRVSHSLCLNASGLLSAGWV